MKVVKIVNHGGILGTLKYWRTENRWTTLEENAQEFSKDKAEEMARELNREHGRISLRFFTEE